MEDIGIATPRFRVSSETAGSFELQVMSCEFRPIAICYRCMLLVHCEWELFTFVH